MRKETSEWTIRMLADFRSRINVEAEYQRAPVWSQAQQALLIDSIMRGFDIPKIFLRKLPDGNPYLFDVIDGKQRLTAIWRFVNNEFSFPAKCDPFPGVGDLRGKRWSDLPDDAKDRLQFANMTVSKIEEGTDDEIRELFLRLQKGEPLRAAEKRNAIAGPVRDFVVERLACHPLWPKTGISKSRFGWHEHSAIILAIVQHGGPTGLKGADLEQLYEVEDFDPEGANALRSIELLDTLEKIIDTSQETIRTRWGIVDLSISLIRLRAENRHAAPAQIMDFFEKFEVERRQVSQTLSDLQSEVVELSIDEDYLVDEVELPKIHRDVFDYFMAFSREGASEENIDKRSAIMFKRMCAYLDQEQGGQ